MLQTTVDYQKLLAELNEEISNEKFKRRTHGRRTTYRAGCDGPLCRKAHRDYARIAYAKRTEGMTEARGARDKDLDIFIERFEKRYHAQRSLARAS